MFLDHSDSPSVPSVGLSEEQHQLDSGRWWLGGVPHASAVPLPLAINTAVKSAACCHSLSLVHTIVYVRRIEPPEMFV